MSESETEFETTELRRNGLSITVGSGTSRAGGDVSAEAGEQAADGAPSSAPHPLTGTKHRGRVVNCKPYGVFVETNDGLFGLAHGTLIRGWDWRRRFDSVFYRGLELEVTVEGVEDGTERMSFSCEMPPAPVEESPCAHVPVHRPDFDIPVFTPPAAPVVASAPAAVAPPEPPAPAKPEWRFGELAERLDATGRFPGAAWIADYMKTVRGLVRGNGIYGVSDTIERLVLPMLGQLGWNVSPDNAALVRGGGSSFDVRLYGSAISSGRVSLAVLCAPAGTAFHSLLDRREIVSTVSDRNVIERILCLYNQLGGCDARAEKVVWTDGCEWVVLSDEIISQRIGIIAEHRGGAILAETADSFENNWFRRVVLPAEASPFAWLGAFADLNDCLGGKER